MASPSGRPRTASRPSTTSEASSSSATRVVQAGQVPQQRQRAVGEGRTRRHRRLEALPVGVAAGEHLADGGLGHDEDVTEAARGPARKASQTHEQQHDDGAARRCASAARPASVTATTMSERPRPRARGAGLEQAHQGHDQRQPDGQVRRSGSAPGGVWVAVASGHRTVYSAGSTGSQAVSRSTRPSRSVGVLELQPLCRSRSAMVSASGAIWRARPCSSCVSPLAVARMTTERPSSGLGSRDQTVGFHGVDQPRHRGRAHVLGCGQLTQRAWATQHQQGQGREAGAGQALAGIGSREVPLQHRGEAGQPGRELRGSRPSGARRAIGDSGDRRDPSMGPRPSAPRPTGLRQRPAAGPSCGPSCLVLALVLALGLLAHRCPGWPALAPAVAGRTARRHPSGAGSPGWPFRSGSRVAEAAHEVVVDEARRLHVGVDDDRADEAESAPLEVRRELLRQRRLRPGSAPCDSKWLTMGSPPTKPHR